MSVTGGIIAGASLLGAGASAGASIYGSNKQADAATNAANLQEQQFQQTQANQAPFIQAGQGALSTIQSDQANGTGFAAPFNFQEDPGYQFNLQQGQNAINSSSAAQGGVLNGGTLKALDQYTTGLADNDYNSAYSRYLAGSQNSFNQLNSIAGLGENATTNTGNAGAAAANASGNYLTQAGNAQAAGAVGAGNAINGSLGTLANTGTTYGILQSLQSQSGYGGGSSGVPTYSSLQNPINYAALNSA